MSKPTRDTPREFQDFQKAAAASDGESLAGEFLGVPGPEQEMVAVADRDRLAALGARSCCSPGRPQRLLSTRCSDRGPH